MHALVLPSNVEEMTSHAPGVGGIAEVVFGPVPAGLIWIVHHLTIVASQSTTLDVSIYVGGQRGDASFRLLRDYLPGVKIGSVAGALRKYERGLYIDKGRLLRLRLISIGALDEGFVTAEYQLKRVAA